MFGSLLAQFREYPVATVLELGSVLVCLCLFAGTFVVLAGGPPVAGTGAGAATPWLAIIGIGAAFVVFWTALVPLFERLWY